MGKQRVLLVGWDAADWKVINPLLEDGLMPNVARLMETGVMGNLATLQPMYSPMLWTSMATGKRPHQHGIHGFVEPDPQTGAIRPITQLSRKCKAIWNILNQAGKRSHVVGWWPSHPAEPIRGSMVSNLFQGSVAPLGEDWPIITGAVHPPEEESALASLRVHPHELDGDLLRHFVPRAPEIDQTKDKRLHTLAKILAETVGTHAAATHLLESDPDWDFAGIYYDGIDHFSHAFMRYHPPRLDWVNADDFALYSEVIRGAYVFHDMMLGRLMELANEDTTVMLVSDHGFQSDHLRPRILPNEPAGPAAEHRPLGVFLASGPGIKEDELVFGASLLDVTPTILQTFGLPMGEDMDGRVLEIFTSSEVVAPLASWEAIPGEDGRHPAQTQLEPLEAQEALRQLVDLGYIDEPNPNKDRAKKECLRELQANQARALLDRLAYAEAMPILEGLWESWPEESRFGVQLFQARLHSGEHAQARECLMQLRQRKVALAQHARQALAQRRPIEEESDPASQRRLRRLRARAQTNPHAFPFLEASLLHAEGNPRQALELLEGLDAAPQHLQLDIQQLKGDSARCLDDFDTALVAYGEMLELDSDNAQAHFGLAQTAFARDDFRQAVEHGLASLGRHYFHPAAHALVASAYERLGCRAEAQPFLQQLEQQTSQANATANSLVSLPNLCLESPSPPSRLNQSSKSTIIVSGLPRSGTSMMMQMLAAGGIPLFMDDERPADESNPRGYSEHRLAKGLARDAGWLAKCPGKAVKVVAQLLHFLPREGTYEIIMMHRSFEAVAESQRKMLARLKRQGAQLSTEALIATYRKQMAQVASQLAYWQDEGHVRVLNLCYEDTIRRPNAAAKEIAAFLGEARFDPSTAASVVDADLWHEGRASEAAS